MRRAAAAVAALLLLILGAMALKGALLALPQPAAAPEAGAFDTRRALARLGRILGPQRPHPVDSAEADAVRGRLIAELRALGLSPAVTDDFACNGEPDDRTISCARVRNVTATIGPAAGAHLLMVSHYDSTPAGPGAADDGIGMATMLETAAALRGQRLQRPVTLLFNEGEETGLLGARTFLQRNPLAARVEALVNLESRGTTGPAIMFETSRPNGAAIARYDRAVSRPVANSLTTDFYRLVPNRSDVTVFRERDWTILNIAVIGNETRYHTPGDRIEALDPASLGHMGAQALALARDFAQRPAPEAGGERIYADVLGRTLVALPAWLGIALLAALLLGFAWLAWRRRDGLGRSLAAIAAALVDAGLWAFLLHAAIGWLRTGEWWRAHPDAISSAIDATAIASSVAALLWLARAVPAERLRTAFWLLFLLLGALVSFAAPGAAIFFLAPPLLAGAGLLLGRWDKALALAAWALLFVTWAPLLHLSQVLLDFDAAWIYAPIAVLLLMPAVIELKPLLERLPRGIATAAVFGAALLVWVPAALAPAYSDDRKQRLTLEYAWDEAARTARWLVYHDGAALPEAMTADATFERGAKVAWSDYRRWSAPAVGGPALAPPTIERIGETATPRGRLLRLRLRSNGAEVVRLRAPAQAAWRALRTAGGVQAFGSGKAEEPYLFRCHGRTCDGLVFELLVGSAAPFEAEIVGMRSGLPPQARPLLAARPATAQPQYVPDASYAIGHLRL